MSDAMIRLEHVSKHFPGAALPAVGDLGFEVPRGSIVTLVGPSGCGKTTTLKMINRIIEPTSGTIWVDGVEATATEPYQLRRSIGYVIQQIGLFPHKTIAQNIGTVPELLGWEERRIENRVHELIELVGLDSELLARYPSELSGGQQQRVGVARALAADPPVLLMDEPFGAVDPIVRSRLQEELLILQDKVQKTIVFVTHDIDEAVRLGDQICILNVGGVLEQIGPPAEVLSDPANEFVDDFIGGERGLKRLGLMSVGTADLELGPMVGPSASDAEARAAMQRYETTWVGVLDGERLIGWVSEQDLAGHTSLAEIEPRPIERSVSPTDSLRAALDLVVRSHERVAIVVDEGRFLGTLDLESIAREISE
ncbi:MAG TPA: ATP-binding cassette domain-containing protein [Acidimicrobiia bacterium]|jgi:osmoprotectant transport system ATP-binding protein